MNNLQLFVTMLKRDPRHENCALNIFGLNIKAANTLPTTPRLRLRIVENYPIRQTIEAKLPETEAKISIIVKDHSASLEFA